KPLQIWSRKSLPLSRRIGTSRCDTIRCFWECCRSTRTWVASYQAVGCGNVTKYLFCNLFPESASQANDLWQPDTWAVLLFCNISYRRHSLRGLWSAYLRMAGLFFVNVPVIYFRPIRRLTA